MYCPSCGTALALQTKYCNRCGAQLNTKNLDLVKLFEQRMDSEMEGLFYITFLGIGLILGGIALMKNVLHVNDWIVVIYLILSGLAFTTYFALGVWQVRRLARSAKGASRLSELDQSRANEINLAALEPVPTHAPSSATLEPCPSVTEHTTRTLQPVSRASKT